MNKKSIVFISITAVAIGSYAYLSSNSDIHMVANMGITPSKIDITKTRNQARTYRKKKNNRYASRKAATH
ncbi:hypothetical protein ACU6U9_05040 [Pseudomonas sp. HK3]